MKKKGLYELSLLEKAKNALCPPNFKIELVLAQ
jgi:hypothetical protein